MAEMGRSFVTIGLLALAGCGDAAERADVGAAAPTSAASSAALPSAASSAAPTSAQAAASAAATSVDVPKSIDPVEGPQVVPDLLAAVELPPGSRFAEAELRAAIEAKRSELQRCLKADAAADVVAKVTSSGSLQDVRITKLQPDDPRARDCLVAVLSSVQVANVRSGDSMAIALKLMVRGGGR
jgi:hypothetical protein